MWNNVLQKSPLESKIRALKATCGYPEIVDGIAAIALICSVLKPVSIKTTKQL